MARFNIYTGNHVPTARVSVEDHVTWIRAGLESLGHEVTVSDTDISKSAMNILFECFVPPFSDLLVGSGVEFGLVMTEHADGGGFNHRRDESWSIRWREFWKVAHAARFLWTLFEGNEKDMQYPAPAAYLELGYTEKLVPAVDLDPIYDFAFFGSLNDHRRKILDGLAAHGHTILTPHGIQPSATLTEQMSQIRVLLDPRGPNLIPMPSITRCGRGIHAKRLVCAEKVPQVQGLTRLVAMSPEAGVQPFVDFCREQLAGDWKSKAVEAHDIARDTMPMKLCMERAIDEAMRPGFLRKGGAVRAKMVEWKLLADVRDPLALDLFLDRTLPSLLTRRNVPDLVARTTVTAEVVARREDIDRIAAHTAFVDFRKMVLTNLNWTAEAPSLGESTSPFGLTPDLGQKMRTMVLRWAKTPIYMMRIDKGRVFSDGTLTALHTRALAGKEATGKYPEHFVVPMVPIARDKLRPWAPYRPWQRTHDADLAPETVNLPHDLVRELLAGMQEPAVEDYMDVECEAVRFGNAIFHAGDALVLAPISPVAIASFGAAIPVNMAALAWRPEPGAAVIVPDSDEALVLEVSDDLAEPARMTPMVLQIRLNRLALTARPTSMVTRRRKAWLASTSWRDMMLVHAGEIDAIKLARAESDAEAFRAWLRPQAPSAIIPAASPAIPPLGLQQPEVAAPGR